jgi:hypothetical protein
VMLIVVDGRWAHHSAGVTYYQAARLARRLGATDAVNLDGGGSSTFVTRGHVRNRPSDGRERGVVNAIAVVYDARQPYDPNYQARQRAAERRAAAAARALRAQQRAQQRAQRQAALRAVPASDLKVVRSAPAASNTAGHTPAQLGAMQAAAQTDGSGRGRLLVPTLAAGLLLMCLVRWLRLPRRRGL